MNIEWMIRIESKRMKLLVEQVLEQNHLKESLNTKISELQKELKKEESSLSSLKAVV